MHCIFKTNIYEILTIYECVEKLLMIIGCNIGTIFLELNWIFCDPSRILQFSEFEWTLRSSVRVVFNNSLLKDATDRSKISSRDHTSSKSTIFITPKNSIFNCLAFPVLFISNKWQNGFFIIGTLLNLFQFLFCSRSVKSYLLQRFVLRRCLKNLTFGNPTNL